MAANDQYGNQPPQYYSPPPPNQQTVYVQQAPPQQVIVVQSTQSSDGDIRLKALIAYLFSWLSGLIIVLIENNSHYVYFHGWQSLILGLVFIIPWIIAGVIDIFIGIGFGVLLFIVWMIWLFLTILCMIKAYQGASSDYFKLPLIGDWAMSNANSKFPQV